MFCMVLRASIVRRLKLDLGRAPYVLYGVKYIDLVSLAPRYFLFSRCQQHAPVWPLGPLGPRYFLFSYHISVYVR